MGRPDNTKVVSTADGASFTDPEPYGNDIALTLSHTDTNSPLRQATSVRSAPPTAYRVYRRRFFGLAQLILLNIVVSWDWLSFSALSTTSANYFHVSESAINWLSTAFLFAFCVASPAVIWTLNRGPKPAIITAASLLLVGNWIRYAGARATGGHFGAVMFGQILIGLAQPFVLSAPTRYSDLWFSDKGRTSATAIASLANPLGGALAQLINPAWVSQPSSIPTMVLYITIISTLASLPSFFIPSAPPTPPSASSAAKPPPIPLLSTLTTLLHLPTFYLILLAFAFYVGHFNAFSSLINQILSPYGYSEDAAGIAGAILIIVGLVTAALTSPLIDRTKAYLPFIKTAIPILFLSYLLLIFAPATRTLAFPYAVCALCGAASFSLVPVALEYLVEITYPLAPEVGSTLCWTGGQLLGAVFIVVETALKDGDQGSSWGRPRNMQRALVFQAVLAGVAVVPPMLIGTRWAGGRVERRRLDVDRGGRNGDDGREGGVRLEA
ncbi:MAG: hypothetical protein Q9160_004888 [Pyrenula sp. 1 TL-2023]